MIHLPSKGTPKKKTLQQWLEKNHYVHMMERVFKGMQTNTAMTKFSADTAPTTSNDYQSLIHLSSYNYSGLNGHPKIIASAQEALQNYGTTTSGVRLLNGTYDLHIRLEKKLADFLDTEAAVTYSSGYIANISVLSALCDKNSVVFSDKLNHQSIIDGLKLSGAKIIVFPHADYEKLDNLLAEHTSAQQCFIVSDSIFSMDGDIADLPKIVELGNKYDAITIIDDAHATGVIGPCGKGSKHYFALEQGIDIITGSLSKGLPGIGGFAACNHSIAKALRYGSNGYIFSASLPPATVAGLITAIEILENEPERQELLQRNTDLLRKGLQALGFDTMQSTTAVIPVLMPSRELTWKFAEWLHEHGIFVNPISFPAVPLSLPRIRINSSAALQQEDIERTLTIFKEGKTVFKLT